MATSSKVLISVKHLVKEYNHGTVHALDGCDLDIHKGEVVAIIGPSGSGKSTLMHCMAGLDAPSSGKVMVEGLEVSSMNQKQLTDLRREQIGFTVLAL